MINNISDLIRGIDHLAFAVESLDESIAWYQETLGFNLVERRVTQGSHTSMSSAVLRCDGTTIVLLQGDSPESQISKFVQACGAGVHHVAFAVDDLDVALERIKMNGIRVDTPMVSGSGLRQVFLSRDSSNGVRIELIERCGNPGKFADQNVERLFMALEEDDLY